MVSTPDTVYIELRVDDNPSFVSSQSKIGEPYQGFFFDEKY
jgi:hypothetical protein